MEAHTNPAIKVDIVSDVVCPWCAVGYKNIETAIKQLETELSVTIQWRPFELNPDMPPEGEAIDEHIKRKYGADDAQVQQNRIHLQQAGERAGYQFVFGERSRIFNTFDCHKLLEWALEKSKQTELKLALMDAYFTNGIDISDRNELIEIVESLGLSGEEAKTVLEDSARTKQVREEQQHYIKMGIRSVPSFIVQDKYLISGGQPVETFVNALRQMATELKSGK